MGNAETQDGTRPDKDEVPTNVAGAITAAKVEHPLRPGEGSAPSPTAGYLAGVLASEASLRAAFEPVAKAARCPETGGVDRMALVRAIARIAEHFSPYGSRPDVAARVAPAISITGCALSEEEAFVHFQHSLRLMLERLCDDSPQVPEVRAKTPLSRPQKYFGGSLSLMPACQPISNNSAFHQAGGCPESRGPTSGARGRSASPVIVYSSTGGCASSMAGSLEAEWRARVTGPSPRAPDGVGELAPLVEAREASRARAKGLRQALEAEDSLLTQQAQEIQRLRQLEESLRGRSRRPDAVGIPSTAAVATTSVAASPAAAVDPSSPCGSPMSLQDLKRHLDAGRRLRQRIAELEVALDSREEQIVSLSEELQQQQCASK